MKAGAIPVLLPYLADRDQIYDLYQRLNGLVFAGGEDIEPVRYGEPVSQWCGRITSELLLFYEAGMSRNKPSSLQCQAMHSFWASHPLSERLRQVNLPTWFCSGDVSLLREGSPIIKRLRSQEE